MSSCVEFRISSRAEWFGLCGFCGNQYPSKYALKSHVETKHCEHNFKNPFCLFCPNHCDQACQDYQMYGHLVSPGFYSILFILFLQFIWVPVSNFEFRVEPNDLAFTVLWESLSQQVYSEISCRNKALFCFISFLVFVSILTVGTSVSRTPLVWKCADLDFVRLCFFLGE